MPELWQPVRGYEGLYEVSDQGSVRSLDRTVWNGTVKRRLKGRELKAGKASNGYLTVALCKQGKQITYCVHVLMAQAFIPNPEEKPVVRHCNDNKTDNRISNLLWGDYSDNAGDAKKNGRTPIGCRHGMSKLTPADVLIIRADTRNQKAIAADYGVSRGAINNIKNGYNWSWLTES